MRRARGLVLAGLASVFFVVGFVQAESAEPPLQALARRHVGAGQGVFAVGEDGTILASLNARRAVHPASVTKVATTLALLKRLDPAHRFPTRLYVTGTADGRGTVAGDLIVEASRDPFFVYENAFLVLLQLRRQGVRRVGGALSIEGPLVFNWEPDPAGRRLQRALQGRSGQAAWQAVRSSGAAEDGATLQSVALSFGAGSAGGNGERRLLLEHRSPPLLRILKELNCYSNNILHDLSDEIGGPKAVERIAVDSVPAELGAEIVVDNAAGAGRKNRMSPRAAAAVLNALEAELRRRRLSLVDVLPVGGIDTGTLRDRFDSAPYRGAVVGKTGTYGSLGVSALAGVVGTRRFGKVTFAILNSGLEVWRARDRQNAFVRALIDEAGAVPWPYEPAKKPAFMEARVEAR